MSVALTEKQQREIEAFCQIARENGAVISLRELIGLAAIDATERELATAFNSDSKLGSKFLLESGYVLERAPVTEGGSKKIVEEEERRRERARANLKRASRFGRALMRGAVVVSVSGANSYLSAAEGEDIDFFCVTKTNGIWPFMLKALILARIHRLANREVPELCFSCTMDEEWATQAFRERQHPIFARDALTAKVIGGKVAYHDLLEEARWMEGYFPAFYGLRLRETDTEDAIGGAWRGREGRLGGAKLVPLPYPRLVPPNEVLGAQQEAHKVRVAFFDFRHEDRDGLLHLRVQQVQEAQEHVRRAGERRIGVVGETVADKIMLQGEEEVDRPKLEPTTLKLITAGRTSGLPHIAIMRFAVSDGAYFVMAGSGRSDWFLNARASRSGKVRIGDSVQAMACEEFNDGDFVRQLFTKKYGARIVKDWYSGPQTRSLKLTPTAALTIRGAIRGEGQVKLDFHAWKAQGLDYRDAVADAFDSASEEYDFTIGGNFINVWIRERSIKAVLELTRPDDVLLEIGCGTGTEAIRISRQVRGVVATDISSSMIALLRRKIEARKMGSKIHALQVRAIDVGRAKDHLPGGKARVAYSFNGALNCELELDRFPRELWNILEPGGLFVCSIRNRFCIEESLVQGALLRFRSLTPRKEQPKMVSVGGMDIPAYYYYPWEFAGFFKPFFDVKKTSALPAIVPPPYLNDLYVKLRSRIKFLEPADVALADVFPFNMFGDQTLFVFQRNDRASPEAAPGH